MVSRVCFVALNGYKFNKGFAGIHMAQGFDVAAAVGYGKAVLVAALAGDNNAGQGFAANAGAYVVAVYGDAVSGGGADVLDRKEAMHTAATVDQRVGHLFLN